MVVGKRLVFLGFAHQMIFANGENTYLVKFPIKRNITAKGKKDTTALFCNAGKTALYCLPWSGVQLAKVPASRARIINTHKEWSGYDADLAFQFNIPQKADTLFYRGQIVKIEYTSDKLERAGDQVGKFNLYTHTFNRPPKLYNDRQRSPRTWGVLDERGRKLVSDRGIIG